MAKYIDNALIAVNSGDVLPLEVTNKCDNQFSVGTGLIFNEDGQYLVTVYGRKIIVEKSDAVQNIPSADVAPVVHAKAIKFYNDPFTGRMFTTCTACDGKISSKDSYCKHCGAKMDLE